MHRAWFVAAVVLGAAYDNSAHAVHFASVAGVAVLGDACSERSACMCLNQQALLHGYSGTNNFRNNSTFLVDEDASNRDALNNAAGENKLYKSREDKCLLPLTHPLSLAVLPRTDWVTELPGKDAYENESFQTSLGSISYSSKGSVSSRSSDEADPLSAAKRYRTCAVVSSSWRLMQRRLGVEIDAHEAVFRINDAPTSNHNLLHALDFGRHIGQK